MRFVRDEAPRGTERACERCLARTWLLATLSGHLDRVRAKVDSLLELEEQELIAAIGGRRRDQLRRDLGEFDVRTARRDAETAGLELICRCDPDYPDRLCELRAPPAVLHVAGSLDRFLSAVAADPVAVVGARAASPYGIGVALSLGRGLAAAGLTVISGMAAGIDRGAHAGALSVGETAGALSVREVGGALSIRETAGALSIRENAGAVSVREAGGALSVRETAGAPPLGVDECVPTVAVLPGPADRPYPKANRRLHRDVRASGAVVSELPPGSRLRSWMFPARNRIIAALAQMTVVVEAGKRSGSLVTARFARELGRPVGAVPGRITSPQSTGSNYLLKDGAALVRGAQDVLDLLFEAGSRLVPVDHRPQLNPELSSLLHAIGAGHDTPAALSRRGLLGERALAALATLELSGYIRREAGGRYGIVP